MSAQSTQKKTTKATRNNNLVMKSDIDRSKNTPVHMRGMSSATTMAMTMRGSNSTSAFNQLRAGGGVGSRMQQKNMSPESVNQRGASLMQRNYPQVKDNSGQLF